MINLCEMCKHAEWEGDYDEQGWFCYPVDCKISPEKIVENGFGEVVECSGYEEKMDMARWYGCENWDEEAKNDN